MWSGCMLDPETLAVRIGMEVAVTGTFDVFENLAENHTQYATDLSVSLCGLGSIARAAKPHTGSSHADRHSLNHTDETNAHSLNMMTASQRGSFGGGTVPAERAAAKVERLACIALSLASACALTGAHSALRLNRHSRAAVFITTTPRRSREQSPAEQLRSLMSDNRHQGEL
jgi:hypothetical protein